MILGVTNPFFAKMLQHWPHVIRIGEMIQGKISVRYSNRVHESICNIK